MKVDGINESEVNYEMARLVVSFMELCYKTPFPSLINHARYEVENDIAVALGYT